MFLLYNLLKTRFLTLRKQLIGDRAWRSENKILYLHLTMKDCYSLFKNTLLLWQ
ncbi:hypothetical protein HMPREF3226_02091 [Prevotella corporis]|uniref:Uncharacterized protein n=1 Tax=Prevotella corporis TaxID=28128 RepID=A0A133PYW0_9BACT|nr:hypothetical protein HMPREF3226_02091 [Prevotella corporis]